MSSPTGSTIALSLRGTSFFTLGFSRVGGAAIDGVGAEVHFYIKRSLADADEDALVHKTLTDGITVLDASSSSYRLEISPDDLGDLDLLATYFFEARSKLFGGEVVAPPELQGDITFNEFTAVAA